MFSKDTFMFLQTHSQGLDDQATMELEADDDTVGLVKPDKAPIQSVAPIQSIESLTLTSMLIILTSLVF